MLAQVNPVLDPLLVTPLRNAVIHSAWGRGKKDLPPGIAKKLRDTTVYTSVPPNAPPFRRDLARSMRVESVKERFGERKFKVKEFMKAITVEPKRSGTIQLEDVAEPDVGDGSVLVEAIAVGVCGTDAEIAEGKYGWAPHGKKRLVLGHESLGRVVDPGPNGRLKEGDLVVGIVRRPDPVPCPSCAVGEWDMCRNGQYTEHGIKGLDGFARDRWRIEPEYAVKLDQSLGLLGVLLEPTSVVAKAWELIDRFVERDPWA